MATKTKRANKKMSKARKAEIVKEKETDPEAVKAYFEAREKGMKFTAKLNDGLESGDITVDVTHFNRLKTQRTRDFYLRDLKTLWVYVTDDRIPKGAIDAFLNDEEFEPFALPIYLMHDCPNCGARDLKWMFDGKSVTLSGDPCLYPDGIPAYSVELNVPSGKMLFGNDFREQYGPHLPNGEPALGDGPFGSKRVTDAWAEVGMAHGFVGNSCPSVWQHSETKLGIWNLGNEDKEDGEGKELTPEDGEQIGGICTDLWWYCIVDLEDFIRHGGAADKRHDCIANVKPGKYRVTYKWHLHDYDDYHALQDYAVIEWIGPCDEA